MFEVPQLITLNIFWLHKFVTNVIKWDVKPSSCYKIPTPQNIPWDPIMFPGSPTSSRFCLPPDGMPPVKDWVTTWESMMMAGPELGQEPLTVNVTLLSFLPVSKANIAWLSFVRMALEWVSRLHLMRTVMNLIGLGWSQWKRTYFPNQSKNKNSFRFQTEAGQQHRGLGERLHQSQCDLLRAPHVLWVGPREWLGQDPSFHEIPWPGLAFANASPSGPEPSGSQLWKPYPQLPGLWTAGAFALEPGTPAVQCDDLQIWIWPPPKGVEHRAAAAQRSGWAALPRRVPSQMDARRGQVQGNPQFALWNDGWVTVGDSSSPQLPQVPVQRIQQRIAAQCSMADGRLPFQSWAKFEGHPHHQGAYPSLVLEEPRPHLSERSAKGQGEQPSEDESDHCWVGKGCWLYLRHVWSLPASERSPCFRWSFADQGVESAVGRFHGQAWGPTKLVYMFNLPPSHHKPEAR